MHRPRYLEYTDSAQTIPKTEQLKQWKEGLTASQATLLYQAEYLTTNDQLCCNGVILLSGIFDIGSSNSFLTYNFVFFCGIDIKNIFFLEFLKLKLIINLSFLWHCT